MTTPAETVTSFFTMWARPDAVMDSLRACFTSDTVWEDVGLGFGGLVSTRVELLALAEVGDKVLTERVDHIVGDRGETLASLRCMGVFEVQDGKIAAWRDYLDTVPLA